MADLPLLRSAVTGATRQQAELNRRLGAIATDLAAERARLALAHATGDAQQAQASVERIAGLAGERAASIREIGAIHDRVALDIEAILGADIDLEGTVPLVLLPVRIEARSTADQTALRVRIFHDALHAETLDENLGATEVQAATDYWLAVWPDGDTEAPWPELVKAVGARRAPWVAERLRPSNLAERPVGQPLITVPDQGTRRPPVARTLPDRFYVRVEQDGAEPLTVHGRPIPDELPVGLTDQSELAALSIEGEGLPPIDATLRWLVDYGEAERLGMAVTVELPVAGQRVDKLVVYGVRAGLDPRGGAERLQRLVRSHRYTDGAEFVPQGTPTNNTESARTNWSRRTPPGPPDLQGSEALGRASNAAVTAAALGLDPATLAALPRARDEEQARAAAFNTALWTTTWAEALEHITPTGRADADKRLDNSSLDAVRDHWVDAVRGRGPLPALRLGRQPYGILPIIATDATYQPMRIGVVEEQLVPFVGRSIRPLWQGATSKVTTIANTPLDTALPEILGTDAVMRALRVRSALSPDAAIVDALHVSFPEIVDAKAQRQIALSLNLVVGVEPEDPGPKHLLGNTTRALPLPLVDDSDTAFVQALIDDGPPMAHKSVLQVLLAHAAETERHNAAALAAPETHAILREAFDGRELDLDVHLVVPALNGVMGRGRLDPAAVARAAAHVTERAGRLDWRTVADRHPIPALAPPTALQKIAGVSPSVQILSRRVGLQLIGELFHASGWRTAFNAALRTIVTIESSEERRLLLSETLDCCSHRLDAWITSAATRRLRTVRADGAEGTLIGAYGWLENIELRTPAGAGEVDGAAVLRDTTDGGYIHAPGLTHAATAAVLRSGRLTHRRGDPGSEALELDLSSTRVRDALALLDGIRRGQSLGALLGYRLERRLHERSRDSGDALELDRFIYVLRSLAPLRGGKLTAPGVGVEESIAASDIVDGLRLLAIDTAAILAKLDSGPTDMTHIAPGSWAKPSPVEADEVIAAIAELERTHDAVGDLLLAESVHQIVGGNPARAAAALDLLGAGEAAPPEPDVVRTPRTGTPIGHRIAIVVADPPPVPADGWDPLAPRALAEPRLEAWAQGALGDPATTRLAADHDASLAGAGLSALDVLYDADGDSVEQSTLAARLRRRFGDLGDDLSPLAVTWELASMLRGLLTAGRPLDVADVGRPVEPDAGGRIPDGAEIVARAAAATAALKLAVAEGTLEALAPFGMRPLEAVARLALTGDEQDAALRALAADAERRAVAADVLLARTVPRAPPGQPERAIAELAVQALAAVFGAGFVAVPVLSAAPADEADLWAQAVGPGGVTAKPGADIRPWLARMGALRDATSAYGEALLVREALGRRSRLRVVQTPSGAYGSWAGLPFPDGVPPLVGLQSMVVEVTGDPAADLAGAVAGIVLDEWTEIVPGRLLRGDPAISDPPAELDDVTTTGIALNANAPGARPPQTILVALSPDGGRWNGERLVHVLDEALALAQMRLVTLDQVPLVPQVLPALYFADWSLQGEPVSKFAKTTIDLKTITPFLAAGQ